MIILFLVFVVQFSVSSACLAINKEQQVMSDQILNTFHKSAKQIGLAAFLSIMLIQFGVEWR